MSECERVTLERLTRFYFLNHFLSRQGSKSDIEAVAGAVCGFHAQLPLTPFLSLWNRIMGFRMEMLHDVLYGRKSLVKTWLMRGTLHVIPSGDLPVYHNGLKSMWFGKSGKYLHEFDWPSFEERKGVVYPRIREALAEGPLTRKRLAENVVRLLNEPAKPYERLFSPWGGILKETAYYGLTVAAQPCGNESCYALVEKWLPSVNLKGLDEVHAKERLFMKYLHCYGPASVQDFAYWSGLLVSETHEIVERNRSNLKAIQVQESGSKYWMLMDDFAAFKKLDLSEMVSVKLLPKYDSYVLGHKDRARIISAEHLRRVYRPVVGDVAATILVSGRIAGIWRHKLTKTRLTISLMPFGKLGRQTEHEINDAVKELGELLSAKQVHVLMDDVR